MPKEYSAASVRPLAERITRCCLSSDKSRRSSFKISESNAMNSPTGIEGLSIGAGVNPPDWGRFRPCLTGNCHTERNYFGGFGRPRDQDVIRRHFRPILLLVER